jgi:hypothetical protein
MKLATLALSLAVAVTALVAVESASAQGFGYSYSWSSGGNCQPGFQQNCGPYGQPNCQPEFPAPSQPQSWCGTGVPRPNFPWMTGPISTPYQPRCGNEARPQIYGPFGTAPRPWQPINMPISADPFAP